MIGMTEEVGKQFAFDVGYLFRCAKRTINGKVNLVMMTMDFRSNRINYEVIDGIITKVWLG